MNQHFYQVLNLAKSKTGENLVMIYNPIKPVETSFLQLSMLNADVARFFLWDADS
jgi:hypothetical protein